MFGLSDAIQAVQREVRKGQQLFKSKMNREMTDRLKHMRDLGSEMKATRAIMKLSCEPFFL